MSFFEDDNAPKKQQADPRVRASGWGNAQLGAHGDNSYSQRARQAQSNSSSIVGGRIVRPVHAQPRSNLPSNVHGFNNTSTTSEASWTGYSTADTDRQRNPPVGSTNSPVVGSTNFTKNAPGGVRAQPARAQPGPSSAQKSEQTPVTKASENTQPPHLRRASVASGPSSASKPTVISTNKASKHGTRAAPSMNSGTAAKSAKYSSKFPCSYADCTQGFVTERELKVHKAQNHDYCRICDEDFVDDEGLLNHKIISDFHICCYICGDDFHSEGGRDRHVRQYHSTPSVCKCVGCGITFDKGSALIHHIQENMCKNRNNRIPKLVNDATLREQRAKGALHLDLMSHLHSNTGELIAAMQPSERSLSEDDNESVGGVSLGPQHILDSNEPMSGTNSLENDDAASDLIELSDDGTVTPQKSRREIEFPSLGEAAMVKDKKKNKQGLLGGMDFLSLNDSQQGTGATMVDYRQAIISGDNGELQVVKTDWDHVNFKRHAVDGHYHCPFSKCHTSSLEINDLKRHLTSGIHQGTDHRCLKCLRRFKTAHALVAHMESNSERCKIKETDAFGQILSVVSGGFLGVMGRHADGTVKIGASTVEELEEQAREQREVRPWEDESYPWGL